MKLNINDEYRKIMNDLENHIKNKEDLEYAKSQLEKLSMMFINEMENMTQTYETKLENLDERQIRLEKKLKEVQNSLSNIEKDIYDGEVDEEICEFEITCPYCNNNFIVELDDAKDQIQCPDCKNIIELDWEHSCDNACTENCIGCQGCSNEDDIDEEDM